MLRRATVAVLRARGARTVRSAVPAASTTTTTPKPPPEAGWCESKDEAKRDTAEPPADGAPAPQGMDFEAGGKPPTSTTVKARRGASQMCMFDLVRLSAAALAPRGWALFTQAQEMGGGLAGVEARAHEAGARALETGADAEREAFRAAASEAIQPGELARCVQRCACHGRHALN